MLQKFLATGKFYYIISKSSILTPKFCINTRLVASFKFRANIFCMNNINKVKL